MRYEMEGRTALVIGGASDIGRACARLLVEDGANVVVADADEVGLAETVDNLRAHGGVASSRAVDVTNEESVVDLVRTVVGRFERLDCAVNSAGVTSEAAHLPVGDMDIATFYRRVDVGLRGTFLCLKYELQEMERQRSGAIVNVASVSGLVGARRSAAHVASNHAVIGLTKAAAIEYADRGVRVNAVCPGLTTTSTMDLAPETHDEIQTRTPLGRVASPEEIAEAIVWLCSPSSSFAIGSALIVDGGFVAQ